MNPESSSPPPDLSLFLHVFLPNRKYDDALSSVLAKDLEIMTLFLYLRPMTFLVLYLFKFPFLASELLSFLRFGCPFVVF